VRVARKEVRITLVWDGGGSSNTTPCAQPPLPVGADLRSADTTREKRGTCTSPFPCTAPRRGPPSGIVENAAGSLLGWSWGGGGSFSTVIGRGSASPSATPKPEPTGNRSRRRDLHSLSGAPLMTSESWGSAARRAAMFLQALCARQCDAACAGRRGNSLELGRHRQLRRQVPRAAIKPCIKHVLNSQLLRTPGVSIEECHAPALSAKAEAQHIFCPKLGFFRNWLLKDDLLDLPDERGPQWRRTQ
jgi:hypothetical protein